MTAIDPYRTLGLAQGATQAEIKVAYRRLAKLNHPDSAGERALPRFLAIQAAYEALIHDPNGLGRPGRGRPSAARPAGPSSGPWQADASRARATREAYRARARAARGGPDPGSTGSRPGPSGPPPGGTGAQSPPGATGAPRPDGRGSPRGPGADGVGAADGGPRSRRSGRRPKATIGSTSYDGADKEPFDPAWGGATWYGAGSGTYWTLNPKEYADPRKHGPEYLARSRRGIGQRGATDAPPGADPAPDTPADPDGWSAPDDPNPAGARAASPGPGAARSPGTPADGPRARAVWPTRGSVRPAFEPSSFPEGTPPSPLTVRGRIGRAVLGWIPLAIGLAALSDSLPACSGVATICSDPLTGGIWLVDLLVLGLLVGVPRLGWIAAIGSVAFFVGGLLATPVLLTLGGARVTSGTAAALAVVLIAAWLGGVVLALIERVDRPPWLAPRVR